MQSLSMAQGHVITRLCFPSSLLSFYQDVSYIDLLITLNQFSKPEENMTVPIYPTRILMGVSCAFCLSIFFLVRIAWRQHPDKMKALAHLLSKLQSVFNTVTCFLIKPVTPFLLTFDAILDRRGLS